MKKSIWTLDMQWLIALPMNAEHQQDSCMFWLAKQLRCETMWWNFSCAKYLHFQMISFQFEPSHSRDKIIDSIKHEQNIYFVGSKQFWIIIIIIFQYNTRTSPSFTIATYQRQDFQTKTVLANHHHVFKWGAMWKFKRENPMDNKNKMYPLQRNCLNSFLTFK